MADVALGVVFDRLLKAVLDFKDKTIYFKSILKKLESRLRSIEPTVREIVSLDRVLNNPEAEMKMLTDWLIEAEELVHKCSKIQWWNCFAKVSHSTKLQKLDDKLRDFFETGMQVVQARDSKKMLVTVNKIDEKLDRMYSFVGSCGAPGVPEFIVGLEEPLQELKTRLLRDDGQVIVLSAPGGCGKTTLAKMLCHDVQIKEKFMDNIFFVTVSKTPILRVIVQNMFRHKSDTVPEFQNDDDALNQLEILLKQIQTIQSSPILLVLDDVWTESESLIHNFKFQIPGYKILVTSRSEFPGFNSTYKLELLSDQDAMALFRHSAFPQGGSMSVPEDLVHKHDLLRELAIHLSSREPIEQRQRLIMDIRGYDFPEWFVEPIQPFHARLLSISTDETFSSRWGSMLPPEVEVLILNFRTRNYSLPKFMEKMDQLKVLIITNYGFCPAELSNFQLLGFLSSLKRIRLEHVSISFLSETTLQLTNLRKISLIMCQIGETFKNCTFEFAHMFPNLVEINIHCCSDLVELPDRLCDIICLKKLSITKCHGLDALPERLGRLTNLEVLRLHSCTGLKGLPESVVSLHKLRILDISDCLNISELPIRIGELRGLETLNMRGCEMHQLPPSVKDLGDLKDVICDEETVNLWEPFKIHLNNARITVLKEDKNLNWLSGLYH
ncbi:probable disease resistance protein At5g66900 isoform X3 [Cornus florida]|uniref:probable disease resistance protein At5g66900 isoform X3 n=1 Tax=Cornus florida TaxID=4283 RepID=UPI00289E21E8|nr:probable disease resistance protein At5g66900 isoform X3 [Cornus florida]